MYWALDGPLKIPGEIWNVYVHSFSLEEAHHHEGDTINGRPPNLRKYAISRCFMGLSSSPPPTGAWSEKQTVSRKSAGCVADPRQRLGRCEEGSQEGIRGDGIALRADSV